MKDTSIKSPDSTTSNRTTPDLSDFFADDEEDAGDQTITRARARRGSRLHRWVEEQQTAVDLTYDTDIDGYEPPRSRVGTPSYAYLAYPQLGGLSPHSSSHDEVCTLHSYIILEEDEHEPPRAAIDEDCRTESSPDAQLPSTPSSDRHASSPYKTGMLFRTPSPLSPFRHLQRAIPASLRSSSPAVHSVSDGQDSIKDLPHTPSGPASRTSTFSHKRGSSFSSLLRSASPSIDESVRSQTPTSLSFSSWKFRRPSVLGYFSDSALPQPGGPGASDELNQDAASPRPSMSSTRTYSTATTSVTSSSEISTPRKYSFDSTRSPAGSMFRSSGPSLWSLPADATHMFDPPDSASTIADGKPVTPIIRVPLSLKALTNTNAADDRDRKEFTFCLPKIGTPRHKRKRRLLISGIKLDDPKRIEGVKNWCESFGELKNFIRMPNGDLEVHFRDNEVADTVCRLNARVYINAVGSVGLSWSTGKRTWPS